MNNTTTDITNKIWTMSGNSLAEKILDYCLTYDVDERELGELLEENEDYKKLLYNDCVKHNLIRDDDFVTHLGKTEEITPNF